MEQSVARLQEGNQVSLPSIFQVKEQNDSITNKILIFDFIIFWYLLDFIMIDI